jgi:hypothetical protein
MGVDFRVPNLVGRYCSPWAVSPALEWACFAKWRFTLVVLTLLALVLEKKKKHKYWGIAQEVEHLLSLLMALDSIPNIKKQLELCPHLGHTFKPNGLRGKKGENELVWKFFLCFLRIIK